ncbi:MAG: 2-dehydropantoate 2-reductase [Pseudomonadota bacterium]|jgi:2-dehydropantoate 2-reductase
MDDRSGRFIIYGAGAIGSVFGGMLARSGHQVSLVGRDPHMEVVRNNGLSMDGLLGTHHVKGLEACMDLDKINSASPAAAVLISVKSNATAFAVKALSASDLVGEETLVVSLQNGLGNLELIREVFGNGRSYGGRVIFGAGIPCPGKVHVSVWADKVLIGGPESQEGIKAGRDLADLLTDCGIQTQAVEDIQAALWGKVLYNVGLNPLSAMLGVPYGDLGRQKNSREVLTALMREAFLVASKEVELPWRSAEAYLDHFFSDLLPPTEAHKSSMLQDIIQGRETEIDAITGQVIVRAGRHGVTVPVNRVVYNLVRAMEKGKRVNSE